MNPRQPGTAAPFDLPSAVDAVLAVAQTRRAFTTDDVWARLTHPSDGRAIANAMIHAQRLGAIRNSAIGVFLRGRQHHARWLAVWLSTQLAGTIDDAAAYAAHHSGDSAT